MGNWKPEWLDSVRHTFCNVRTQMEFQINCNISAWFSYNDYTNKQKEIMAEKLRQAYIDSIMQSKYSDDEPKYDHKNRAFLETLTMRELENLSDELILEEDL